MSEWNSCSVRLKGAMGSLVVYPTIAIISTLESLKKTAANVETMTMNPTGGPGTPEEYQWRR